MAKKASHDPNFHVAETVGKAAEGPNSLLSLNIQITEATSPSEVFDPMWHLCLACANQRKLISKVRGDSNDFLNYATTCYVVRWQKQTAPPDGRRPVSQVQNWIPYILGTIRFSLIQFNKDVYDYDILPLPTLMEDEESDVCSVRDVPAPEVDVLAKPMLEWLSNRDSINSILMDLPAELKPYLVDIMYYMRTKGNLLSRNSENFAKVGKALFGEQIERVLAQG